MNKKWIVPALVLFAALLIAVVVCIRDPKDSVQPPDPSEEVYTVVGRCLISDRGHYLLIQENNATELYNVGGDENLFEGIETGDEIEVSIGMVMQTYPGRTNIYSIRKLSDGSIDDISQEVIDDLTELGWLKEPQPVIYETPIPMPDEKWDRTTVSWVNWSDDESVYFSALNRDKLYISSVQHLPVYKVDTAEEFADFKKGFGEILSLDSSYDEVLSFEDVTAQYGKDFFEEYSLIIAYVTSGSGSDRFGVSGYYCSKTDFCMYVKQTNDPEDGTCDMAGWFLTVAVEDELLASCAHFDAVFGQPK